MLLFRTPKEGFKVRNIANEGLVDRISTNEAQVTKDFKKHTFAVLPLNINEHIKTRYTYIYVLH